VRNNSTWAPSAPSPIAWPREAWNLPLTLLCIVGVVVVAVVPQFVYEIVEMASGSIDVRHPALSADQTLIAQIVSYVPLGVYLFALLPWLSKTSLRELGFRLPTARDVAIAGAGAIVMIVSVNLAGLAIAALTHRQDTETAVALMQHMKTPIEKFVFFAVACILAPLIEELAFRIFIFNALTRYLSIGAAALVSGVLFGLLHSASLAQIVTVAVPLAIGGIVLAYVYAFTRCYWANVTTHALFNAVGIVPFFVFHVK
jgi:membrane protease YdiL (CAAX protease family)